MITASHDCIDTIECVPGRTGPDTFAGPVSPSHTICRATPARSHSKGVRHE